MVRIRGVETLDGFRVRLALSDGTTREVDLGPYLNGPVDDQLGTIVWPNGADIDPDVLIHGRIPALLEASKRSRAV